jgi:hypothetical protein
VFEELVERFDASGVRALVLMGSHARGEAGPYSDIDLVRFTNGTDIQGAGSYLYQGHLLVVSNVLPDEVERWFREPQVATDTVDGLRRARALLDREGYFALLSPVLLPEHRPLIEQTVSLIRARLEGSPNTPIKGNSQE